MQQSLSHLGLLGGAFDPIHSQHLALAGAAMQALGLDTVRILPCGDPPHKRGLASAQHRWSMVTCACEHTPFTPDDSEVFQPEKTYTVQTLRQLECQNPGARIWFIMGQDNLAELPGWYELKEICARCFFAVGLRPDQSMQDPLSQAASLAAEFGARIIFLPFQGAEVSSTQVRERVQSRLPLDGLVPPAVAAYIHRNQLYI